MSSSSSEKRFHCQHCNEKVSKTLYYQHKSRYYCPLSRSWIKESSNKYTPAVEDFTFSDVESGDEGL